MTNESAQLNLLISRGFAGACGELLPEFQRMSGMKVTTGSGEIEGSKRLIEFLASGRASEAIRNSGMEPLGKSQ